MKALLVNWACELAALIGVEDCRLVMAGQGVLQGLDAKARIHGVRYPPRQHFTGRLVVALLLFDRRRHSK